MASRRGLAERTTGNNLSLMSQLVFDWLDEIFDDRAADALIENGW